MLAKRKRTYGTLSINQSRYNDVDWSFYDAIKVWIRGSLYSDRTDYEYSDMIKITSASRQQAMKYKFQT